MRLSVIIPVYNEVSTILDVIQGVQNCGVPDIQIIAVDDYSTDGTWDQLQTLTTGPDLNILRHETNFGKGAAIRSAQKLVNGNVVVIQDADLEYSPKEFPKMLQKIEMGIADAVFGSRYSGSELLVDTFWHYLGNKTLTTFSNIISNLHLTDMETCYKMIKADIFKNMVIESNRFGIEPELTAKLARLKCRIYEVPIPYMARSYEGGKKIGWKDGIGAFWFIIKYNLLKK